MFITLFKITVKPDQVGPNKSSFFFKHPFILNVLTNPYNLHFQTLFSCRFIVVLPRRTRLHILLKLQNQSLCPLPVTFSKPPISFPPASYFFNIIKILSIYTRAD